MRFSTYLFLFLMMAFCSCEMSRFYAAKRIGGNHQADELKECQNLVTHSRSVTTSLSQPFPDTLSTDPVSTNETFARANVIPPTKKIVAQKNSVAVKKTPVLTIGIKKSPPHIVKSFARPEKANGEFWAILIYIMLCCISLGLVLFLFAWILSPIMVALRIALWAMLGLFVFLVLVGIFFGFTMGDRHNTVGF